MSDEGGQVKEYTVRFPVAGILSFYVEAQSEEEAIAKAWEIEWSLTVTPDDNTIELVELYMLDEVTTGNISHAPLNRVEVIES